MQRNRDTLNTPEEERAGARDCGLAQERRRAGRVGSGPLGPEQTVSKEFGKAEGGEWEGSGRPWPFPSGPPTRGWQQGHLGPCRLADPGTVLKRQAAARSHAVTRPGRLCVCTAFCESAIQHQDGTPRSTHHRRAHRSLLQAGCAFLTPQSAGALWCVVLLCGLQSASQAPGPVWDTA